MGRCVAGNHAVADIKLLPGDGQQVLSRFIGIECWVLYHTDIALLLLFGILTITYYYYWEIAA